MVNTSFPIASTYTNKDLKNVKNNRKMKNEYKGMGQKDESAME
jgi:hypothetical protein